MTAEAVDVEWAHEQVSGPEWDVSFVVPTIPPRWEPTIPVGIHRISYLDRCLHSIWSQTKPPAAVVVEADLRHDGAWVTRGRGLAKVTTPWVAFVDDDDKLLRSHLLVLAGWALLHGADYVYSWFRPIGMADPFPDTHFGTPFDPDNPRHTTMNIMVRTELAQQVGFTPPEPGQIAGGEDWRFTLGCLAAGAKIVHAPFRTWLWFYTDPRIDPARANTSGRGENWL